MMATTFNHFSQIGEQLDEIFSQVVRKTAFDVQAQAAKRAPVDTGFLRNSVYVVTSESSTYGEGGSSASLLPEVPAPDDRYTAYAAVGANYGGHVNYGTRFMAAQPYWEPAIDAVRPSFEAVMEAIESRLP